MLQKTVGNSGISTSAVSELKISSSRILIYIIIMKKINKFPRIVHQTAAKIQQNLLKLSKFETSERSSKS